MKLTAVSVALIILAVFAAPTLAAEKTFEGEIIAVNSDAHTVELRSLDGVEKTFHFEASTTFFVGGQLRPFNVLRNGDRLSIRYDEHVHKATRADKK
jgi:hypothetical protein